MKRAHALLLGAFVAGIAATPVLFGLGDTPAFAAANANRACLQNNRIWSWRVVNDRTMIVADRQNRQFLVRLTGSCLGLRQEPTAVRFQSWTSLGCLENGDRVSFREPTLGRTMTCVVTDVTPYGDGQMRRYEYYDDREDGRGNGPAANPGYDDNDRNDPYRR